MTVPQAAIAISQVPATRRVMRSRKPVTVSSSGRRLYRPARPPAKASRNSAPKPMPWISPHSSRSVSDMVYPSSALYTKDHEQFLDLEHTVLKRHKCEETTTVGQRMATKSVGSDMFSPLPLSSEPPADHAEPYIICYNTPSHI